MTFLFICANLKSADDTFCNAIKFVIAIIRLRTAVCSTTHFSAD